MKKLATYFILTICISLFATYAIARPVIADLSLRQIEIDSGFQGTEILLFGARIEAGDVAVVVRGPQTSYIVRKKERIAGLWMNRQKTVFEDVNGFYKVAASRPLDEIRNNYMLSSLEIGIDNLDFDKNMPKNSMVSEFKKALLDKKLEDDLYSPTISDVSFIGDTLFRTIIKFPENIPRGIYTAEIYLFSDGQLSGVQSTPLIVKKKGFDAFVYDFSRDHPAFYGILAVLIAITAGWVAGTFFRKV